MDCDSDFPEASDLACQRTQENFERITGEFLPCEITCTPNPPEACNGADDDCNGVIDEDAVCVAPSGKRWSVFVDRNLTRIQARTDCQILGEAGLIWRLPEFSDLEEDCDFLKTTFNDEGIGIDFLWANDNFFGGAALLQYFNCGIENFPESSPLLRIGHRCVSP